MTRQTLCPFAGLDASFLEEDFFFVNFAHPSGDAESVAIGRCDVGGGSGGRIVRWSGTCTPAATLLAGLVPSTHARWRIGPSPRALAPLAQSRKPYPAPLARIAGRRTRFRSSLSARTAQRPCSMWSALTPCAVHTMLPWRRGPSPQAAAAAVSFTLVGTVGWRVKGRALREGRPMRVIFLQRMLTFVSF